VSQIATALLAELDDQALEQLAALLAPKLTHATARGEPEAWLTVDQAADYLACGKQRIYNLVSQRRIRFAKDGSRVLFRRQWLDDILEGLA
jgi:excisionase family DNA binding protein